MDTELPRNRIRTIMKSSLGTGQITNEVLHLMTRSTEMFIGYIAKESYKKASNPSTIKYEHLADFVHSNDNLEFLLQIVPNKIKVKDLKTLLEQEDETSDSSTGSE